MKLRLGFVSNSSASSFVLPLHLVDARQLRMIENHGVEGRQMGLDFAEYPWNIEVTETEVRGWTSMTNFNMEEFLGKIGVTGAAFSEYPAWDPPPDHW